MHEAILPPGWPRPSGYSNGVLAEGRWLAIAGQIGWNAQHELATGFLAQSERALENVVAILRAAGGGPEHLVRLTWYLTDRRAYLANLAALGEIYRRAVGAHYPAMTAVEVRALIEPEALVEIEATAVLPATA